MLINTLHNGRKVKATEPWEQSHARGRIVKARLLRDGWIRLYWTCGCTHDGFPAQVKEFLSMPQPCEEHKDRPQVSCEVCYPDEELRAGLERMQSVKVPSAPSGSPRKKPKRLDEMPAKKRGWRDEMFS